MSIKISTFKVFNIMEKLLIFQIMISTYLGNPEQIASQSFTYITFQLGA